MIETLQVEEQVKPQLDPPRLLVEWGSPWQEFVSSIEPAFSRSHARLAGEAPFGLIPLRIMVPSYFVEAFLILAAISVQVKVAQLRPYVTPRITSHDVIYFSGDELPRTQDLGGAESGTAGRAGGEEAHHRTQTIKVARGGSLVQQVVDAPNLKLPASRDAVANLLAIKPDPGPPPAEGLRSARSAPGMVTTIVAPSPDVVRDYTRNGVQLDSVIAPAPSVTRDRALIAPSFTATLIPPAPNVSSEHKLVAPALAPTVIPPAPNVARDRSVRAPSLNPSVVAPAPSVSTDRARRAPALASQVIPPAPASVSRQMSSAPVHTMDAAVVPPPVSAPERATNRASQLTLPSPSVVAPPPSANISSDMRRLAAGSVQDPAKAVVPPPPSQSGSGTFMSSLIGRIFGPSEVVPPPPSVNGKSGGGTSAPSLAANIVPPAPTMASSGGNPQGSRRGAGTSLGSNVVAPPPSVGAAGGTGNRPGSAPYMGNPSVISPPPSLPGAGGGSGSTGGGAGSASGTLATNVVPPPPSIGGGSGSGGSGVGRKGVGLGAPLDAGSNLAQPSSNGSGKDAGTIASTQPGSAVAMPSDGRSGALALSPSGGDKPGLGGSGGGSGIGRGDGSGSAMSGTGPGAGRSGTGRGSDVDARGGISPSKGPGGAGRELSGTPAVPGVDVSGGSNVVTLPSFGSDPAANDPSATGRSHLKGSQTLGVTVVATANSGGAFEPYKNLLRGEKYTTYLDTSAGTVVMEFADEAAAGHPFGGTLTSPSALRTELAEGLPHARMVVTGTLDASGNLKNLRVLEPGPANMTTKVMSSLRTWKFQPAMRGNQPVEVTAILGFGIDTNDRF